MPTEGVREVWQEVSTFNAQQIVSSTNKDPLGVLAPGGIAYDPLGHRIVVQNPVAGQPPSGPQYGPSYYGAGSSFTDAYNLSTGCYAASNKPQDCDSAMQRSMREHPEFWENLPHMYQGGGELRRAEQAYQDRQDDALFWMPIAATDNQWGIRLPFRRSPVPGNLLEPGGSQSSGGQQLSQCLRDALRQFFPNMNVRGNDYSPIDDARFKSGIPIWVRAGSHLPGAITPVAITLGLYDIHYDSNSLNINGGSSQDLKTILEEVSHTKQFLDVWAGLRGPYGGKYNMHGPNYSDAQSAWKAEYFVSSVKGLGYNNELEKWAKNNANKILQQLVNDPQLQKQGNVCGFDLKTYKIQFIP